MQKSVKETLTVKDALEAAATLLEKAQIINPRREAYVLMCHTLSKDISYVIAHENYILEDDNISAYTHCLQKRMANMPVAYITGKKEFMSLEFKINENVLIPRPDTEILAETAISAISGKDKPTVLDLCCGSGCVGISIAEYVPQSFVTLADISKKAVELAEENADALTGTKRCEFIVSDLFENIPKNTYDIIVSNPPYISETEYDSLSEEIVLYEPKNALIAGADGLIFYEKIASQAPAYLKEGGYLIVEIGCSQSEEVSEIFKKHKFTDIGIIKDLAGLTRVVKARCGARL